MRRKGRAVFPVRTLLLLLLLTTGSGFARELAGLVPGGTLAALQYRHDANHTDGPLATSLGALDWEAAADTARTLAESSPTFEWLLQLAALPTGADFFPELEGSCAAVPDLVTGLKESPSEGLISVGFAPFNPVPRFLALQRSGAGAELVAAVSDCVAEEAHAEKLTLTQDGREFTLLLDGSSLTLALAEADGIIFAANDPEYLRSALRLLNGSGEPSLLDSAAWQALSGLRHPDSALDWLADYTVLADVTASLAAADPSFAPYGRRAAAALRTAGRQVGSLHAGADGLTWESLLLPDADGGDPALHELLLGGNRQLGAPPLRTDGAVLASSGLLDLRGWFDWFGEWLKLEDASADLHELLLSETGLDAEALLLGFYGGEVHSYRFAPVAGTFRSLLWGPDQALLLSVSDEDAARRAVGQVLDAVAAGLEDARPSGGDIGLDVRSATHAGSDWLRVRLGPLTDVGVAVKEGFLVLASPAALTPRLLDELAQPSGEPAPPAGRVAQGRLDVRAELGAVEALARQLVQPLAFALRTAVLEDVRRGGTAIPGGGDQDWSDGQVYDMADLRGLDAGSLSEGQPLAVELEEKPAAGPVDAWFRLADARPGVPFSVRLETDSFDAYLELYELETGHLVAYNDDYDWRDGWDAQIDYTPRAGVTYVVRATSWLKMDTGPAVLSFRSEAEGGADAEPDPLLAVPAFGQVLDLLSLGPDVLGVIGRHTGGLEGFSERRADGTLYSRLVLELR